MLAGIGSATQNSPFYLPIRNNDISTLRQLIRELGPQARDAHGNSPLMYATALGSLESVRILLDSGVDPNSAKRFRCNAAHVVRR
jgi:ankyrin repeat protein